MTILNLCDQRGKGKQQNKLKLRKGEKMEKSKEWENKEGYSCFVKLMLMLRLCAVVLPCWLQWK